MVRRGQKPDAATYRTLLHGYATKGALVDMHDLLDLMIRDGIPLEHRAFNILICAYAKHETVNNAMAAFIEMRHKGLFTLCCCGQWMPRSLVHMQTRSQARRRPLTLFVPVGS
jgi:pentatricopeptide repeat protein